MVSSSEGYLWTPKGPTDGLETKASIATPSIRSDCYDVVVIGAGFAGLVAARNITQQTRARVLLLDARDRIGGRTWTAIVAGEEIEMGGTWVHWNQPHLYAELVRYGLHRNLKASAGTSEAVNQYYKGGDAVIEEVSPEEFGEISERVCAKLFQIDGLSSRELMPFPHDPLRDPAPWKKYDHLSVQDRLDQMKDVSKHEKAVFASLVNSFGSAPPEDTGLVEVLRWYALGGHTMAQTFELAGTYKIGTGGMTNFALSILRDYKGDLSLKTPISQISQDPNVVAITTRAGKQIKAKYLISTIPL
ncbi:uncharacterized protein N0V89_004893 [Didymosphaeria variabile]|uniref:monoamine oxidase n=1 Tax=Didymosphaeria variabile TaxID=1932322 RepID=A0A9W8XSP8_9PLEO|nr:uncharacterized protein N0V89_004893 [Didymosphaeria variabile]KAJ4356856.1 hypothetical protein N0V89_004893 [Didymosphaeria variabile]